MREEMRGSRFERGRRSVLIKERESIFILQSNPAVPNQIHQALNPNKTNEDCAVSREVASSGKG